MNKRNVDAPPRLEGSKALISSRVAAGEQSAATRLLMNSKVVIDA